MLPPAAASLLIRASSRLRGWSWTARQPECEQMMGARDKSTIWSNTSSEAWLASSTTPRSLASCTNCFAQRRQPAPFLLVGGGIAELVVEEMHRPRHAHAQFVKAAQQGHIVAQDAGILDRLENDDLPLGGDARRIFRPGRPVRIGRDAPPPSRGSRRRAGRRRRACALMPSGVSGACGRVDGEEAALQPAFHHARDNPPG